VRASLDLSSQIQVPVIKVSSKTGEGLDVLWQAIREHPRRPSLTAAADLLQLAQEALATRFWNAVKAQDPRIENLVAELRDGTQPIETGTALLRLLASTQPPA